MSHPPISRTYLMPTHICLTYLSHVYFTHTIMYVGHMYVCACDAFKKCISHEYIYMSHMNISGFVFRYVCETYVCLIFVHTSHTYTYICLTYITEYKSHARLYMSRIHVSRLPHAYTYVCGTYICVCVRCMYKYETYICLTYISLAYK